MAITNLKNQSKVMPLPIPGRDNTTPDAVAKPAAVEAPTDPTEEWLNAHPTGEAFADTSSSAAQPDATAAAPQPDAGAPTQESQQAAGTADAGATHPSAPAPADDAAATPPDAAAPTADATTPAQPQAVAKPEAPAQPAAAEPVRLALEGKYLIADGTEPWSGAQVIEALRERAALEPRAAEADGFKEFFGADLARTKEAWTPMIEALRSRPERIAFLEDALQQMDDAKFAYLQESSQYWDNAQTPVAAAAQPAQPAQPTQPQYAQLDPMTQKRLEHFEKVEAEREAARQWNAALVEFPVLRDRGDLRNSLMELFNAMYQRDPSTTLEDALRINRPMYQAIVVATGQPAAQPEAQPVVPALNGSPGAAPGGTRARATSAPKKFTHPDDAVEDWLRSHPS